MRFLSFFILLPLGLVSGHLLAPFEEEAVRSYLLGFPNANENLHNFRPWVIRGLFLVPALGALWYSFASILDRYLFRKALSTFLVTTTSFLLLFLLMDFQDSMSDLTGAKDPKKFLLAYYGVMLSQTIVLLLPFTTLLSTVYTLGQLSNSKEIVGFSQTGRGIFRILGPLIVLGTLLSIASFCLYFHLAPWAEGYREALLDSADKDQTSQASNVMHHTPSENRHWFIGGFPYDLSGESPLVGVHISTCNEDGTLKERLSSPRVSWDRESGNWSFQDPALLIVQAETAPEFDLDLPNPLVVTDWIETPSQLVQVGLDARYQGIPGIQDWLETNPDRYTFLARAFETQLHYRWARPWLCLVTILLAAPLGINFSRRGKGGTVTFAILLSALMLFSSEVFLALGDSGQIPAIPAAWATNLIFLLISLILIHRRIKGRSIIQSTRRLCGG